MKNVCRVTFGMLAVGSMFVLDPQEALAQSCNNNTQCLSVSQSGTGDGINVFDQSSVGIRVQNTANGSTAAGISSWTLTGVPINAKVTGANAPANAVEGFASVGNGIYGTTSGTYAQNVGGVYGTSTGTAPGVRGSTSVNGTGVVGHTSGTGIGVFGESLYSAAGVKGYGVLGYTNGPGSGVYGQCNSNGGGSGGGWAVFADGDLGVSGIPKANYSTFGPLSDVRLKKDVRSLDGALEGLLRLRGVTFDWKDPSQHGNQGARQRGFIAQDVEKVFPDWVISDPDGLKRIAIPGRALEAMIVESIRALKYQNDALREQNDDLKKRVELLERGRSQSASTSAPIGLGGGMAFGLLPIGMIAAVRFKRRRDRAV